jgi:uncharacterized protein
MEITEKIRQFVEKECKKPTSKYGYDPYIYHFVPMAGYAKKLAKKFDADEEIVIIAVWLHDIGAIMVARKDHHLTGAKIARQKLEEFDYPKEKIDKVVKCILNHRGSVPRKRNSIEEQILAEADALSAFDDITNLFNCAFVWEHLSRPEAKESVRTKLKNKWKQLKFKESKELIRPKYEAAMLLLK